jgi:prolipoprotein diacylglyceryltransferase
MNNEMFILSAAAACGAALWWGSARLSRADRQIIACVPVLQKSDTLWTGINFTYYGAILATAQCAAVTLFCILMGSLGYPLRAMVLPAAAIIGICVPAARFIARLVEKKTDTFTVAGASFTGFIAAPLIIQGFNAIGLSIPVMPSLAALSAAYAIGEGLGRLGCISFGCCYGKPIDRCHPCLARIFGFFPMRFSGRLKKAAYENGLDGVPVVPVQTLASSICIGTGLSSAYLFLEGHFGPSFLVAVLATQVWRFLSEFLRYDHRDDARVSTYQFMSLIMAACSFLLVFLFRETPSFPTLALSKGFATISSVSYIIFIEALWVVMFLTLGKSTVTGSELYLYVRRDRI